MGYFKRRFAILFYVMLFIGLAADASASNATPVVYVALWGDAFSQTEISDFAERRIRDRLQNLIGVATVTVLGERRPALQIRSDPQRLAAYGLRQQDVEEALSRQAIKAVSTRRENDLVEFVFSSMDQAPSTEVLSRMTLPHPQGYAVRLFDVATVVLGAEKEKSIVTYQGKRVVALGLIKKWWANTPAILIGLREAMPTLRSQLPKGMSVEATFGSYLKIEEVD